MSASQDVLGSPQPGPRRRGPGKVAVGLVALGTVAVAGVGMAAATFLGGGGPQPEDVLPDNAIGMVKLDLDPAAGQKIAVYRLAKKFPSTSDKVGDQDDIKDDLLAALFEDEEDIDYASDIRPWIGDRIGLAAVPGTGEEPEPIAAVAYTDKAKAQDALRDMQADSEDMFFAFSEKADYVLIGDSQETVDAAADKDADVLADNPSWEKGVEALDGDQIVTAWADLDAFWDALPEEARGEAAEMYGLDEFELGGTFVIGAHAGDDHVEIVGRGLDIETPFDATTPIGGAAGSGMVQDLPADTVAAVSITNLGSGLADLFDTLYGADDPLGIEAAADEAGLSLPDDLRTLLGDETVLALFGEEEGALRTRSDDPDAAYDIAQSLLEYSGGAEVAQLTQLDEGIALASSEESLSAIADGDGGLGGSDVFRTAVPDGSRAGMLLFVDIARAIELTGTDPAEEFGEGAADVEQLEAFGMTSSGDHRNSTFRMRLTVKG